MLRWVKSIGSDIEKEICATDELSFNHLGHQEECSVRVRSILQGSLVRQRLTQALGYIVTSRVPKRCRVLPQISGPVPVRNTRHLPNMQRIQPAQPSEGIGN